MTVPAFSTVSLQKPSFVMPSTSNLPVPTPQVAADGVNLTEPNVEQAAIGANRSVPTGETPRVVLEQAAPILPNEPVGNHTPVPLSMSSPGGMDPTTIGNMSMQAVTDSKLTLEQPNLSDAVKVTDSRDTMSTSGSSSGSHKDAKSGGKRSDGGAGTASSSGIAHSSVRSGAIGKIRRHRMTKEEEARFKPQDLVDLTGSTAAKSRKMSMQERDIMLHKRRLRNRASAARSRDKQRKTINDVGDEVDELMEFSKELLERCIAAEHSIAELRDKNDALTKENLMLRENHLERGNNDRCGNESKVVSAPEATSTPLRRTGSMLHLSMSSEMLDKLVGSSPVGGDLSVGDGLMRIASKLHLSLSTDRLSEGSGMSFPCISGSLPSLSRNMSIVERLLDLNGSNGSNLDATGDVKAKQ